MTTRVGFIGLGRMGLPMCYRLLQEAVRPGLGEKDGAALVLPLEQKAGFQISRLRK